MPQQTFSVSENARVQIRACHTRVSVSGWDDAHTVMVDNPARQEGDTIIVENLSRVTVRVPRAATVMISDCEADVRVEDLAGRVELEHIGGDVALRHLSGETQVRDVDGNLVAKDVKLLKGEGTWRDDAVLRGVEGAEVNEIAGDVSLSDVGTASIQTLGDDLRARGIRDGLTLGDVRGDVSLRDVGDRVTLAHVGGDFIASGVRGTVDASDVEGDAVVSLDAVSGLTLRADGDIVINLPEAVNAEIELDAPHGEVVARAEIKMVEQDENYLRGMLGIGGAKVQAESAHGDVILRVGPSEGMHFEHAEPFGEHWAEMGQRIAAEVRQSLHESLADFKGHRGHYGFKFRIPRHVRRHRVKFRIPHEERMAESREAPAEEKPRGPAAGSPERKAILDAIARGELSVDEAIRKLTGEE